MTEDLKVGDMVYICELDDEIIIRREKVLKIVIRRNTREYFVKIKVAEDWMKCVESYKEWQVDKDINKLKSKVIQRIENTFSSPTRGGISRFHKAMNIISIPFPKR